MSPQKEGENIEIKLRDADRLRDALVSRQRKQVEDFYREASEEARARLISFTAREGATAELQAENYRQLESELDGIYQRTAQNVGEGVVSDMTTMSRYVTNAQSEIIQRYGFPAGSYMINVPQSVVLSILTGSVYKRPDNLGDSSPGWYLSGSIWGQQQKVHNDIHKIIAKGVALGDDVLSISRRIEQYVLPGARKSFDWSIVYPGVAQNIDYNAQRLVRTLLNHAYQQTFKETGSKNPWIEYYTWNSVFAHGRTCPTCMDMDGNHYAKDGIARPHLGILGEMPLDHPNGLCYFTYEMDTDNLGNDIADWILAPEGTYPAIDEYMRWLQES